MISRVISGSFLFLFHLFYFHNWEPFSIHHVTDYHFERLLFLCSWLYGYHIGNKGTGVCLLENMGIKSNSGIEQTGLWTFASGISNT